MMELGLPADNPTIGAMADLRVRQDGVRPQEAALNETSNRRNPVRSASFKYYIHDGVDCCRLQVLGEFTETEVPDLSGCWNTVKTTLAGRAVVLDLAGLRSADDAAKGWLVRMAAEGATIRPENYLRDGFSLDAPMVAARRSGLLARCFSLFRRSSALEV
jgi:hypothetical protein